ncbi:MAG: hypothetical protein OSJ72_08625 [Lachnospiraceae bacterium]|nr:hypothetical protein [Lachnospiraceae bacterium]
MEKKYYFRGLGLGIIVTALIMGIALSRGEKREMTDAEVIARAKELGMTENTRLLEPSETAEDAENQEETEPSAKKETAEEPVKKDVAVAQPKGDAGEAAKDGKVSSEAEPVDPAPGGQQEKPAAQEDAASNNTPQKKDPGTGTNEMTKQDEDTGQGMPPVEESEDDSLQQTGSTVSITIVSGDGSYTVAKKLEDAGAVLSASDYDDYLCQNGYDKRLRTGTFQIPAGAGNEQIARIVTGQP